MPAKKKTQKIMEMNYMKDFACIGGVCEDNCCIGWDVDIDYDTYLKYQKVNEPILKKLYKEKIKPYPYYFDPAVDYARVKLSQNKRCPFLTEKGLCMTQAKLGESFLSNVCATYPRMTNSVDGVFENTLTLSCPVAAKLVLLKPEGLTFAETTRKPHRTIVNLSFDTANAQFKNHPVRYFKALRAASLAIVLDKRMSLNLRLFSLGHLFENLSELATKKQVHKIPNAIETFMKAFQSEAVPTYLKPFTSTYKDLTAHAPGLESAAARLFLVDGILERLNVFKEIDSRAFVTYTKNYQEALFDQNLKKADPKRYLPLRSAFNSHLAGQHSYILENYVHNFIIKNLFPFTESENLFEAYAMLVIRVITIETFAATLYSTGGKPSPEDFARFIQVFAKAVEHHKNFSELTLNALRTNDLLNMVFLANCLELG